MPFSFSGPEGIANGTLYGNQSNSYATVLADGRIIVVWENQTGMSDTSVYGRILDPNGMPLGPDILLSTLTGSTYSPVVAARPDGGFLGLWNGYTNESFEILGRQFDSELQAQTPADVTFNGISEGAQHAPQIAAGVDGRFLAVWYSSDAGESDGGPRIRLFDETGQALTADALPHTGRAGLQDRPAVTALTTGGYVVAWETSASGDVHARMIGADGAPLGQEFTLNSSTVGTQYMVKLAPRAGGGFLATWASLDGGDGDGWTVRARLFDTKGRAAGSDFVVNAIGQGPQTEPTVALLADGRFLVAWRSDSEIVARLLSPSGRPIGEDVVLTTIAGGWLGDVALTALPDGRVLATWNSIIIEDTNGYNVRMRIIDPTIFAGTGADEIWEGGSLSDRLYGRGGNDDLRGQGGADQLTGDVGNDRLRGDGGDDRLWGGVGDDQVEGGEGRDRLWGGAGADRLLGGTGDDRLEAGADDDRLEGQDGADWLDGGTGNDRMAGGAGNDTYIVSDPGDRVTELQRGGSDTVRATVDWVLGAEIEALTLTGSAPLYGAGNVLDNDIRGNDGANLLRGMDGNDRLRGGDGRDRLEGGAGDDRLEAHAGRDRLDGGTGNDRLQGGDDADELRGGRGRDVLEGGSGADRFIFASADESGRGRGARDTITDFARGEDKVDLSGMDANSRRSGHQDFDWIGGRDFSRDAGELRYASGILSGDVNGDGRADFDIAVGTLRFADLIL